MSRRLLRTAGSTAPGAGEEGQEAEVMPPTESSSTAAPNAQPSPASSSAAASSSSSVDGGGDAANGEGLDGLMRAARLSFAAAKLEVAKSEAAKFDAKREAARAEAAQAEAELEALQTEAATSGSAPAEESSSGEAPAPPPTLSAALATFFRVLGDTLSLLLRLVLVEPLSWVLDRMGLQALVVQRELAKLEKTAAEGPLDPARLAAVLRAFNKHGHHAAVVDLVEARCLGRSGAPAAALSAGATGGRFAVNAAVVREYLTALVVTGRLSQFGDDPSAAPDQGQSHRSLRQLLAELQALSAGQQVPDAPGATVAHPLHVIVQSQEKGGSGPLSFLSNFLWSCIGITAVMYVMTAGAAAVRRLQGGGAAAMPGGLPGASAGMAAATRSEGGMFAAKEYSKENLPEKSVKRFNDVKGCDEAIAELQEIVEYLKHPDKFTRLGGKLPKGVLLTGPPGTGKTLLARAVAGEAGVPFFYKAGSEFDEMFVGVGSRRVRSLFAAAKRKAPCIIFIDEIDAMGGKRTNWESSGGSRKTLNQLLTDMDGFEENSGIVVMAATNLPELLDTALTRPGRFDRQVAVTLPDVRGRQEILDLYLAGKPVAPDVDTELLARRTPGFSGAELANLVNESALLAARHDSDSITTQLLDEARDKILMGTPRVITQSEEARRLTAYHEGGHALVALYTPGAKPIHKATIVPRGHALGMVSQVPEKDEYSVTRQQMQAQIDVCMGGKAAEELIFGEDHVTSGATSDLRQATRLARHMVVDCGMSDAIGPVAVGEEQSPSTRQAVDAEVQGMLKAAYNRVTSLLKTREAELHSLAQALLQNETLTLAEIRALLNGPSSPEVPGGGSGAQRHPEGEAAGLVAGSEVVAPVPAPAAAAAAAAVPAAVPPAA
ncbi:hypothetical protein COHA_004374 [Chlorella ohadii]|uniref:AAA+ ATPase domain-containing protein n=1 Tax=Chlorella ohadii TaxID=2649997 RepID=A0AAD5DTN0_9CHLO|nr:hypothetical protein COHA_004374 [Chlorella ohadii]